MSPWDAGPCGCTPISPRLTEANRLLGQRDALAHLLGDILATLQLPANRPHLPEALTPLVERWARRFAEIDGKGG